MNVLIIGQGIAGSCLAWELKRRGADFTIADRPIAETASRVAALSLRSIRLLRSMPMDSSFATENPIIL